MASSSNLNAEAAGSSYKIVHSAKRGRIDEKILFHCIMPRNATTVESSCVTGQ
jgi:hypothetical protein